MTAQELKIEFENELKGTRRVLEAVDFEKVDYKPHPKSFAFGDLTAHLANVASWGLWTVKHNEYRMTMEDAQNDKELPDTKEELLTKFDSVVAEFLDILGGLTQDQLNETWTFYFNEQVVFAMPRQNVLKATILNHMIHHRGQLTVYLRMNDLKVPGLYGPTADDQ
ncbi:MAG: hypothetical protein AMXMBFR49_03650 [Chlorobiota bacterium]|nr:MAG: damage-inducible protein DinB [Chlorobiota bacterium]